MVKVGDKIRNVSDVGVDITVGNIYTVTRVHEGVVEFLDDNGDERFRWLDRYEIVPEPPPATIQHEGYEYIRGVPVIPEWLKDGQWVANIVNGEFRKVIQKQDGKFYLAVNGLVSILYHEAMRNQYLPFTNSDWKWGMWAEHDGEKVFVCENSVTGVYASKKTDPYFFAPYAEINPTTAP